METVGIFVRAAVPCRVHVRKLNIDLGRDRDLRWAVTTMPRSRRSGASTISITYGSSRWTSRIPSPGDDRSASGTTIDPIRPELRFAAPGTGPISTAPAEGDAPRCRVGRSGTECATRRPAPPNLARGCRQRSIQQSGDPPDRRLIACPATVIGHPIDNKNREDASRSRYDDTIPPGRRTIFDFTTQ